MDSLETLKILLDNPKLKEDYGYSDKDINEIDLTKDHSNKFIQFMQESVMLMCNDKESIGVAAGKLIKSFG